MAAYTTIDDSEAYFQVVLYNGDGADGNDVTLPGDTAMQPDFVWIKERSTTNEHRVYDSVRGVNAAIHTSTNGAETAATAYGQFDSFDSDGFTVGQGTGDPGNGAGTNADGATIVAWCWKAGTSFSNDASATSVGSLDSAGSINTTAGFSIIEWTNGTSSAQTIAHGLSAVPKMIIMKVTGATGSWNTYHGANTSAPETDGLYLNSTAATEDNAAFWNDTAPTSAVYSTGTNGNLINNTLVAYCFAEKQGFSKFGSFVGNGNVDGPFVFLGFRPAFILIKKTTGGTANWIAYDNKRLGYNPTTQRLLPNVTDAEQTISDDIDFLSNGFKMRTSGTGENHADNTHVYAAFAEAPFVNSNGVPCNAR